MSSCIVLFEMEMKRLDEMTRSQLIEAVLKRIDCLPLDLQERISERETDELRLLLLTARLIYALRHLHPMFEKTSQPSSGCSYSRP